MSSCCHCVTSKQFSAVWNRTKPDESATFLGMSHPVAQSPPVWKRPQWKILGRNAQWTNGLISALSMWRVVALSSYRLGVCETYLGYTTKVNSECTHQSPLFDKDNITEKFQNLIKSQFYCWSSVDVLWFPHCNSSHLNLSSLMRTELKVNNGKTRDVIHLSGGPFPIHLPSCQRAGIPG